MKTFETDCPTTDMLEQFLQLALTTDENEQVGRHVQACLTCQAQLDRLTDSHLTPKNLDSTLSASDDGTVGRLVQGLCQDFGVSERMGCESPLIRFEKSTDGQNLGILEHYLILRELGSGATATVFEAVDSRSGERVAIKLVRGIGESTLRRVQREAEVIAQTHHEGIVSIRSIEVTKDGRYYLVMPMIDGKPLSDLINGEKVLTLDRIAEIVAKIADALEVVHQIGLLHRDVKPSNILVDKNGSPKLTDFGAVAFQNEESSLTETGVAIGTPCYMSPEQARAHRNLDARTDIYSLGATLYECLTRVKPFRGSTVEVIRQVLCVDPIPPRRIDPSIPIELEVICMKALSKEAWRRYRSAKEMGIDLARWRARSPIFAKPLNRFQRAQIWIRRNPMVSILVACLVTSIIVGMLGILWNWRIAVYQRDLARDSLQSNRRAIQQFYLKIGGASSKLDQPGLQPLRRELLNEAVVFYKEFLTKWPDDPMLAGEMVDALISLAEITESLGNADQTIAAWRQAERAIEALPSDQREQESQRIKLYQCRFHQANGLTSVNRLDEAIAMFKKVRSTLESFNKNDPKELRYRRDLASCAGSLGNCLLRRDSSKEAASYYRQASEVFQQLLAEDAANVDLQVKLATTFTNLALCVSAEEQIEVFEKARTILLQVYAVRRSAGDARRLSKVDLHQGVALSGLGRKSEAEIRWFNGIQLLKPHVAANPDVIDLRDILGQLYFQLGSNLESSVEGLQSLNSARAEQEMMCNADPKSEYFREQLRKTNEAIELRLK